MDINLSENFPIIGFDPKIGAYLSRNGDITVVYEAKFASLNSLSADDYKQINENFRNAFAQLPSNTLLHAQTYFTFQKYDVDNHILQNSQESYLGSANESLLFEKSFKQTKSYLSFTLCRDNPSKKSLSSNGFFSSAVNLSKKDINSERIEKFIESVTNYLQVLASGGLTFEFFKVDEDGMLGTKSALSICEKYLMLTQDESESIKGVKYIKEENCLRIGEKRVGIFNIDSILSINDTMSSFTNDKKLSTEMSFFPSALCKSFTHKIDGECIYNVVIFKENIEDCKESLRKSQKMKKSIVSLSEENTRSLDDTDSFFTKFSRKYWAFTPR